MNGILDWLQLPAIQRLGWTLLHFLWQGTIIAWLAALVLGLLRNRSASARYVAACAAMLALAAAPVVTFFLVRGHAPVTAAAMTAPPGPPLAAPSPPSPPRHAAPSTPPRVPGAGEVPVSAKASLPPPQSPAPSSAPPPASASRLDHLLHRIAPWLPWMVMAWLIGVVVLSIRLAGGWIVTQSLRRLGTPAPVEAVERFAALLKRAGITKPVCLLVSAAGGVPSMVGWLKPVILLPVSILTDLSPRQLEAILAHELAHIRRHDYLVNLLQCVLETLLFYHPAIWWISASIRRERENACDDLAVQWSGDRLTVAKALTAIEELRGPVMPLAMAARDGALLERIKRLLGHTPRRSGGAIGPLLLLGVVLLGVILSGKFTLFAAEPSIKPAAPAATRPSSDRELAEAARAALQRERDKLLKQADEQLRKGLIELSRTYPQLRNVAVGSTKAASLEAAMFDTSEPGTLSVNINWPAATKTGPMEKVPAEQQYNFSVILREPTPEPVAAADFGWVYPKLNLVGWKKASAGDPKLAAALRKLIAETSTPLEALSLIDGFGLTEHAGPQPPVEPIGRPVAPPAARLEGAALWKERDRLLAAADQQFREGVLALEKDFPQLRKAAVGSVKMESFKAALEGKSEPGTVYVQVNWPPMNKAGPMQEVPEAERYDITFLVREAPNEAVAAQLTSLCPKLKLVGQVGMQIGDVKLAKAIGDLMNRTLAPLIALDRAQEEAPKEKASAAAEWGKPLRGLQIKVEPAKPQFTVGEPVELIWTFRNVGNEPMKVLDVQPEYADFFHQALFTDTTGKDIACTSPAHSYEKIQQVQTPLAAGATIQRRVTLNGYKLAGLGHPYTAVGQEARVFNVKPTYTTRVGNDIKDPRVWIGELEAPPALVRIVPQQHPLAQLSERVGGDAKAIDEARAIGVRQAEADLKGGKPVILYYGKPWSQGKPLVDDGTGLPVEILAGCAVTPPFVAGVDAYNSTIRNAKVRHPPQKANPETREAAKPEKDVEQPLMEAWGEIEKIDHPLLAGVKDVGFDGDADKLGPRSMRCTFIRNAVWKPKANGPSAEDPAKPYVWIQTSIWRKDVPSQPPPTARQYERDPRYTILIIVKSSDAELQKRIEKIMQTVK